MTLNQADVAAGTNLASRLAAATQTSFTMRINRVDAKARTATVDHQLLEDLITAPERGHATQLTFRSGSWSFAVNADPRSPIVLDTSGETSDVLSGREFTDFEAAVARNDAREATRIAAGVASADVQLSVINDPDTSGFHWVRSAQDLHDLLTGPGWVTALKTLTTGPTHVLIDDAADAHIHTDTLNLTGPAVASPAPPPMQTRTVAGSSVGNLALKLPSPHLTSRPQANHDLTNHLTSLVPVLHAATRRLAWARMATDATLGTDGTLTLAISGARDVQVRLAAATLATDSSGDIDLYDWTFGSDELARYDSTVHAASLAILHDTDVATAATPTLRTARSVYRMAKAGAVAEAMATRRAARQAVQDAAKAAADSAREASGKATERCLVQAGAAVAVVLTNGGGLIDDTSGYLLIGLIALLGVISLLIALCVELKSARDALTGGLKDLDEYQEAIPLSEITAMRDRSEARKAAKADLKRGTMWASIVYGVTILAVIIVGAALIHAHASSKSTAPAKPKAAAELSVSRSTLDTWATPTTHSNSPPTRAGQRTLTPVPLEATGLTTAASFFGSATCRSAARWRSSIIAL